MNSGRDSDDQPPEGQFIEVPDPVAVKDLATALHIRPFVVIADLMEMGEFATSRDLISFENASLVVSKHGYIARRRT